MSSGSSSSETLFPKSTHAPRYGLPTERISSTSSSARQSLWFSIPTSSLCRSSARFARGSVSRQWSANARHASSVPKSS